MFEKLVDVKNRYDEINQLLMDPTVINDNKRYKDLMKEYKNLTPIVEKFDEYTAAKNNFEEAKEMLDEGGLDPEFKEIVQMQYEEGKETMEKCGEELKILLLPILPVLSGLHLALHSGITFYLYKNDRIPPFSS